MGRRPVRFVDGSEVDSGSKGRVSDGVSRELRLVLMVSSSWERESRRKSRRYEVLKQKEGERSGVG